LRYLLTILLFLTAARLSHAQSYWQQKVDYTIEVSLNDIEHTLDGFVKMQYANNSPDTLAYIYIHCWPNAFKNDKTAFSDQLLANGRTDFYFSDKSKKGYLNRLDFRVNGEAARMEDHPQFIDVIKVVLPHPLPPGQTALITTPFHEQLPYNFSRGGHIGNTYQVTQWYPKPAVYDRRGWHPMPYLDQGEFYSDFGDYDVRITVPKAYIVAATGKARDDQEQGATTKTIRFSQKNVHDFAWFADKNFIVRQDTLRLPSGRIIDIYSYFRATHKNISRSIPYTKEALLFHSHLIGEYPYDVMSVVQIRGGDPGGMEYPTITSVTVNSDAPELNSLINHEVGHQWFYGAIATNERRYPWMDEGINTYYDQRYQASKHPSPHLTTKGQPWLLKKFPASDAELDRLILNTLAARKQDQPITTSSEDFTAINYQVVAYGKTSSWLQALEDSLGRPLFDSCMRSWYQQWQLKHPYPEDFRAHVVATAGKDLPALFAKLDEKGPFPPMPSHRKLQPTLLFNYRNTDKIDYINIIPAPGYNKYDKFMPGLVIHNYNLPSDRLQFLAAPVYGTASHQLNGFAGIHYSWFDDHKIKRITAGIWGERFSSLSAADSNGHTLFGGYYKLAPSIRVRLGNGSPRSTQDQFIEWKTFLIGERGPAGYVVKSTDSMSYVDAIGKYRFRYLNQLSFQAEDQRVLYPWKALLQLQQAARFYRINFTGNYFFNYAQGGGMDLRIFAAKFGYLGGRDNDPDLMLYQPKLTGVGGNEDYTYSNYFLGRNEFTGFASRQIVERDGNLKIRVPSFPFLEGRSDDWVSSLNLSTTLPSSIIPAWLPLKLFLDVGTYAGAWKQDALTSRFLYVGGLQLSLFHNTINFYAPLLYSSDFRDQLRTVPDQNTFWKKLSFSIEFRNIELKKIFANLPF